MKEGCRMNDDRITVKDTEVQDTAREGQDTAREGQDTAREGQDTAREGQDTACVGQDTACVGQEIARNEQEIARKDKPVQRKVMSIYERLEELVPIWRDEKAQLLSDHGDKVIDTVTVGTLLGGMRGAKVLPCVTSDLDPNEGIRFRGYTIPELMAILPRPPGARHPYPTALWYLLLTGDVPTLEQTLEVEDELKANADPPQYVYDMIRALPPGVHPMTQFSVAIIAMQRDSEFSQEYFKGAPREDHWRFMFRDSLRLIGCVPAVASYIFRRSFRGDRFIQPDPELDWAGNFAHMLGIDDPDFYDLIRLFLLLHADHEGGNVSAHTGFLVGSALSDVFYSVSAALNGLAGPLHGLANQEALRWILKLTYRSDGIPSESQVEAYAWRTLKKGLVIPGFGHAILRVTDPRYTAFRDFAMDFCPQCDMTVTLDRIYRVVPDVLRKHGKAKNPFPNVDAHSGALLHHFGLTNLEYYTVLFGMSRMMGIVSQLIWARAVGYPLERPKSLTFEGIRAILEK